MKPTIHSSLSGVTLSIRIAETIEDKRIVTAIRDLVYVREQGRLAHANALVDSFAKYEAYTTYFVGYADNQAVATIKVTEDSDAGLPCEQGVDLTPLRSEGTLVEIGHCITVPDRRWKGVGISMMREAVAFCVKHSKATHALIDLFIDGPDANSKVKFFELMGFRPFGQPYRDVRFSGSPESIVCVSRISDLLRRRPRTRAYVEGRR